MNDLETQPEGATPETDTPQAVSMDELLETTSEQAPAVPVEESQLRAVLEAIVYVADEPLTVPQIAEGLGQPPERVKELLDVLVAEFEKPEHGIGIREVAGGYKMATKAEHHDTVRNFAKSLKTPLKLSLPALETLAVIAYKQPITTPEILAIRGVQGGGVLKTLLDRKLITEAGRKNVIGKPILYKTTKEFLIQFGLKDLSELPSLKEFEDLARMAMPEMDGDQGELNLDGDAATPAATSDSAGEQTAEQPQASDQAGGRIEEQPESGAPASEASDPAQEK